MALTDKYKNPIQRFPITITTYTPVCVKSHDDPLSPLADYVYEEGEIHFINQEKFSKKLNDKTNGNSLATKYANIVSNTKSQDKNKNDKFKAFLKDNNIHLADISNGSRNFSIQGNMTEISRHIHSAGRAYIPGSTLKGIVRNALFFDFYKNQTNRIKITKALKGKKGNKIFYNGKEGIKVVENYFLAKNKGMLYNEASCWGFEDSSFIDASHISIIQLSRKRLIEKEEEKDLKSLSVLQEIIKERSSIQTTLFVKNSSLDIITKRNSQDFYKKQNLTPQNIFKALNLFTKSFIEHQKSFIQHNDTKKYEKQLEELEKIVSQFLEGKNQQALCCIGFGKSMLQNTLALSVQDNWSRLRIDAPSTFFVDTRNEETIGWCILSTDDSSLKLKNKYELTEISECQSGDEALVRTISLISEKPKKLKAQTLFKGEQRIIDVLRLNHTNYKEGDWLNVELMDKSKSGEFKQARFKEHLL